MRHPSPIASNCCGYVILRLGAFSILSMAMSLPQTRRSRYLQRIPGKGDGCPGVRRAPFWSKAQCGTHPTQRLVLRVAPVSALPLSAPRESQRCPWAHNRGSSSRGNWSGLQEPLFARPDPVVPSFAISELKAQHLPRPKLPHLPLRIADLPRESESLSWTLGYLL